VKLKTIVGDQNKSLSIKLTQYRPETTKWVIALRMGGLLILLAQVAVLIGNSTALALAAPPPQAQGPAALDPNPLLAPPLPADGRVKTTVALHVLNLSSISEVTERFQLTGYLVAQWRDPRLVYQPTGPNDRYRTLAIDSVWRPQLVIINGAEPRETFETSLRVEPDGLVSYIERFNALLTSTFYLKSFPFDRQQLGVIVHPFTDQQKSVTFVASQLPVWTAAEFNTYSSLESWQFKSITFNISLAASQFGEHAIAETRFEITVQRAMAFTCGRCFCRCC
jgi:hypothetical protein